MLTIAEKALDVNLDSGRYGTFAEIGAGQEVVRWFFQVGGAAGTVSKSISAYDMQVSDAIYGGCERYVSRQRLEAMLAHEQALTRERRAAERGPTTRFFTFADTVSARNYHGTNECHAWMGIRFQAKPGADDSVAVVHVRMLDDTNAAQQEALGIVGVNLVYGAFAYFEEPERLLASLVEGLGVERVEIDMVDLSGAEFDAVDNRVMSLRLVQLGLSGAAMFGPDGNVLQPSEALRKRPLLVQRGRFRPVTHVNVDLLQSAHTQFAKNNALAHEEILPLMEISMHNLIEDSEVCLEDFVSRAEAVSATDCAVMISDFREYHRLTSYLARYTERPIGLAMGLGNLRAIFDEQYYRDLDGGILEGCGRLFKDQVQVFVYPRIDQRLGRIERLDDLRIDGELHHLLDYLLERGRLVALEEVSRDNLKIDSPAVLRMIRCGDRNWAAMVPGRVATRIRKLRLFGHDGGTQATECQDPP